MFAKISKHRTSAKLANLITSQKGAAAIEYALIASLIGVALIGSLVATGENIDAAFSSLATAIEDRPAPMGGAPAPGGPGR